ncbi:hypothetical protein ABVK25_007245 [Lepraria finkii]|uniref:RecA family profile 1 domain-containing protein n=1 Tax=Lepraria finkii TaxID=1340010 RepID=A0ABR4B957_9LECA
MRASSDTNNFSSSSPHRLPTLSASQALQNLSSNPRRPISTGLSSLDAALQGRDHDASSQGALPGGLSRGELTEVYGPPGVGKTALAMQISASVLHSGGSVVWVDAAYRLVGSRLNEIISCFSNSQNQTAACSQPLTNTSDLLDRFHHYTTPTLPHLLALLTHQATSFPPPNTSLIVIDSFSTLFALAFPKTMESTDNPQTPAKKSDAAQWAGSRKWAVMGDFISKIGRHAATTNIAILLTGQTTTRIRSKTEAVLHPAISGTGWDSVLGTRVVLFRDWTFQITETPSSQGEYVPGVRFAGVVKAKGVSYEGVGKVVALRIEKGGLREIKMDRAKIRLKSSPPLPTSVKRKRGEIADSESEEGEAVSDLEFSWALDDNALRIESLPD